MNIGQNNLCPVKGKTAKTGQAFQVYQTEKKKVKEVSMSESCSLPNSNQSETRATVKEIEEYLNELNKQEQAS